MVTRKPRSTHYCGNGLKGNVQKLKEDMVGIKTDISWLKRITIFTAGTSVTTGIGIIGKIVLDSLSH